MTPRPHVTALATLAHAGLPHRRRSGDGAADRVRQPSPRRRSGCCSPTGSRPARSGPFGSCSSTSAACSAGRPPSSRRLRGPACRTRQKRRRCSRRPTAGPAGVVPDGAGKLVNALQAAPRDLPPSSSSRTRRRATAVLGPPAGPRDDDPPGGRTRGPAGPDAVDGGGRNRAPTSPWTGSTSWSPGSSRGAAAGCAPTSRSGVDRADRRRRRLDRPRCPTSRRWSSAAPIRDAHAVLTGTAAALYLGLWNRGDDIAENGTVDALGHWREQVRVSW